MTTVGARYDDGAVDRGIGPAGYHDRWYADRDWRAYRALLAMVVGHSEPGPLLDLGCGTGLLLETAARWGWRCAGIDGSADAVAAVRRRAPDLDVHQAPLSARLPLADASFQTVILNQVIEHRVCKHLPP